MGHMESWEPFEPKNANIAVGLLDDIAESIIDFICKMIRIFFAFLPAFVYYFCHLFFVTCAALAFEKLLGRFLRPTTIGHHYTVVCVVAAVPTLPGLWRRLPELWSLSRGSRRLPAFALRQRPQWQFLERDQWRPTSDEFTQCLELAYKSGRCTCEVILDHGTYDVDLQQCMQTNRATGRQRRVRREILEEIVRGDAAANYLRDREKQHSEQQEEIASLSTELSQEKIRSEEIAQKNAEYEQQIRQLTQNFSDQLDRANPAENSVGGVSQLNAEQEQHIQQLTQNITDLEAQLRDHAKQKAAARTHSRRLSRQASDSNKRLEEQLLSSFPDVDTISSQGSSLVVKPVPAGRPLHSALSRFFLASMTQHRESACSDQFCQAPQVEITRICEIINRDSLEQYRHARKVLGQRRPQGCSSIQGISAYKCEVEAGHVTLNECVLFHGCPFGVVESIQKHGFDTQRGGEATGAMFGTGTYFAENASKSDRYTTCSECSSCRGCKHPQAERCILVVRVLLGETKAVTTEDCRSCKRAPEGCDSVTAQNKSNGGKVDHTEFVVYKDPQALVRWLIYYRHKSDCECHNCKYRRG